MSSGVSTEFDNAVTDRVGEFDGTNRSGLLLFLLISRPTVLYIDSTIQMCQGCE